MNFFHTLESVQDIINALSHFPERSDIGNDLPRLLVRNILRHIGHHIGPMAPMDQDPEKLSVTSGRLPGGIRKIGGHLDSFELSNSV